MHVVEVRHVDDVVDQLAAVGVLDRHDLPDPVGVLAGVDAGQLRRQDVEVGLGALGVVPDQHLAVADRRLVALGAGAQRHPAGVRDLLALAVAAPAPVVERAGDLVALDRALGEVAAHVPAVAVEHVELALRVLPDDELAAERLDAVRLAVARSVSARPRQCQPRANRSGGVPWSRARALEVVAHGVPPVDLDQNENRL